jgi:ADP-heptose:LPS heptosyltransferase
MLTSIPPMAKASSASTVLQNTGLVHGYFRYMLRTRNLRELIKLWWSIVRWRPQVLVDLSPASGIADARRNSLFFRICGVSRQIGVPLTEDMQKPRLLAWQGEQTAGERYEYECSRLVRNIASLGSIDLDSPTNWDLNLTPAELSRAAEVLAPAGERPIIAVSFGTKNQSNEWGQARWRELLGRLGALYPTHALAVCGAQVEASEAEQTVSEWREKSAAPVMNLCGMLTPRESAAVFRRAVIALGHDSGPMHLAAAVQTPCVAVFSARNPAGVWFPYGEKHQVIYHHVDCEKCGLEVCVVEGKKCIYSITVDEVIGRVHSVLTNLR